MNRDALGSLSQSVCFVKHFLLLIIFLIRVNIIGEWLEFIPVPKKIKMDFFINKNLMTSAIFYGFVN